MGGSEFDEAFADADDELFETFGEKGGALYDAREGAQPCGVGAVLQRNVGSPDGGGFTVVELAVDLRIREVPSPCKGDLLTIGRKRYVLNEYMGADGLINRFSLMPSEG
jgi:hypothetical protein